MLIQASSPRPVVNVAESPTHVRIHTLRKANVSSGEVLLVIGDRQIPVEPSVVYQLGESGFEALDCYLPFWRVFGKKPVYDENAILSRIQRNDPHRVNLTPDSGESDKLVLKKDETPPERLTGVQLALLGAGGYHVIVKSSYRSEGAVYEQRVLNFTIHCPVNGGGIVRIADFPVDIANPTFDPYAPEPEAKKDYNLQIAFERTHKLRTSDIEERRRKRIADAEANIRANENGLGAPSGNRLLPKGNG